MGKILLSISFLLILACPSFAKKIDVSTAKTVAGSFLQVYSPLKSAKSPELIYTGAINREKELKSTGNEPAFYVFSGGMRGFVIVSAESSVQPVLGYSFDNDFIPDDIPAPLKWLFNDYSEQIRICRETGVAQSKAVKSEWDKLLSGSATVEPLVSYGPILKDENGNLIQWGQGAPFNNQCPIKDGKRVLVGCVQTAEAQVFRYWMHPPKGEGENSYLWEGQTLGINFSQQTYDWSSMPAKFDDSWTNKQEFEVAKISYHLGIANEAAYNLDGTGSNTLPQPLVTYFGFDESAEMVYRKYFPDTFWVEIIKKEVSQDRPVIISGGSDKNAGHAFVCDGFDSNNLFHINWGWEGKSDGFYIISKLTPGKYDFSYDNQMIINLFPKGSTSNQKALVDSGDSLALVALYNSTGGDNWENNSNWLSGNVKEWYGIKLAAGRVYEINLPGNNLDGTLPDELSNLSYLCRLYLNNNKLSQHYTVDFKKLQYLKEVNLADNDLSGRILEDLVWLQNLEKIELSGNNFSGEIPEEAGQLINLTELSLHGNNFSGAIPSGFGNLQKLYRLLLHDNLFSGEIPSQALESMVNLAELVLRNNQFEGEIPEGLSSLNELWRLDLSNNRLSGEIPGSIFENTKLINLNLSNNQLSGPIPKELGEIDSDRSWVLLRINLSNNNLEGAIPGELGQLSNVEQLNLSDNQLSGELPAQLFNIEFAIPQYTHSSILDLSGNNLSGSIPEELFGLTQLQNLYLNGNSFSGSISEGINNLAELRKLDLSHNNLVFFSGITSMPKLESCNVTDNNLMFDSFLGNQEVINDKDVEFLYYPQKKIGEVIYTPANIGDSISFSIDCAGNNNIYQWYLNNEEYSGKSGSNKLIIDPVSAGDFGDYRILVTNSAVPGLVIESEPVKLFLNEGITKDSMALVALFFATNGENWAKKDNWLVGPVESWYGIKTGSGGRVVSIDLSNHNEGNNLSGEVPKEIVLADSLRTFNIGYNNITRIPDELKELPVVRKIDIRNNKLSEMPVLSGMEELDSLFVENNSLLFAELEKNLGIVKDTQVFFSYSPQDKFGAEDTILVDEDTEFKIEYEKSGEFEHYTWKKDKEVTNYTRDLPSLRIPQISLSDAGVYILEVTNDSVPGLTITSKPKTIVVVHDINKDSLALVELFNATNGWQWERNDNWLEGPVSGWYGITVDPISGVTRIDLRENNLNGQIKPGIGELKNLEELYLSSNLLSGNLPPELMSLPKLRMLYLSRNNFSGTIPAGLSNLNLLEELYLFSNQLEGSIPEGIGNLTQLKVLNAGSNKLTGTIPTTIGGCVKLELLDLGGNQLSGSIPNEIAGLHNLAQLILSSNELTGPIPDVIGGLPSLEKLSISNNKLTGQIPLEIENLANLTYLDIGSNNLSGEIPAGISNLSQLSFLCLSSNKLTGEIPEELGGMAWLKHLDLGMNDLSGEIPDTLGNMASLTYLSLDSNKLSGEIPPELGGLANLEDLYLRNNSFSGAIPDALTNCRFKNFYIDDNQFVDLPDFDLSNFTGEYNIGLSNNYFTFEDIEKNADVIGHAVQAIISPQAKFSTHDEILTPLESSVTLERLCGGENNHYVWYKEGRWLEYAPDSARLIIASTAKKDYGEYYVEVSNSLCPGLILTSHPVILHEAIAVSNNNVDILRSIKVYPNPAKDFVTIAGLPRDKSVPVSVFSYNGTLLTRIESSKQNSILLGLKGYPDGIYFINIDLTFTRKTIKVVKN
ncbi:MAG: T9SS type A sorting domain-containing protein [Chlorobi bacterium]|nr:T9SS type A sorting domain-containing protein [Chlorobiota bacterium]